MTETRPTQPDIDAVAEHLRAALSILLPDSVDLVSESMVDTPRRLAAALAEMTSGYAEDPVKLARAFDAEGYDQVVAVRGIRFASLCEHHVLPFTGTVSVAYLPAKKIIGLSKIPRMVRAISRRLQVQERMTQMIAAAIKEATDARGVGVLVRGRHSCMSLRGIEADGEMVTSVMLDAFRDDAAARAVLEERVAGLLEEALLVENHDFRSPQGLDMLEAVVAVDDAAIEVVQVGGREASALERDERTERGRDNGKNGQ